MNYSYLNQSFDPACSLTSPMDSIPSACQLTCSGYPDLGSSCSQIAPGYGRYPNPPPNGMQMRANPITGQPNGPSMIPAPGNRMAVNSRTHADHMQTSMFQTGIGLQSEYFKYFILA